MRLRDYGLKMSDYNIRPKTPNFEFRPENFDTWFGYMKNQETEPKPAT